MAVSSLVRRAVIPAPAASCAPRFVPSYSVPPHPPLSRSRTFLDRRTAAPLYCRLTFQGATFEPLMSQSDTRAEPLGDIPEDVVLERMALLVVGEHRFAVAIDRIREI